MTEEIAPITSNFAKEHLQQFIERIERLEEEKAGVAEDIKEVYAEARSNGFETKIMREIVKLRKLDSADRAEHETLLDVYMHALGMIINNEVEENVAS